MTLARDAHPGAWLVFSSHRSTLPRGITMTSTITHLTLTTGTSRGRETYGYTIVSLRDDSTGKRYRTMGGGYDMVGTVLGDWLQATHQDRLQALHRRAYYSSTPATGSYGRTDTPDALYGLTARQMADGSTLMTVDGACGESSVRRIFEAIGLDVHSVTNRRGHTVGYVVTERDR